MAFTVDLINTNPRGAVRVTADGDQHDVEAGGTLTVTPETAGEAPHWRKLTDADDAALRDNPEAMHWRLRAGTCEVYDLGSGLLAQTENWQRADGGEPADPLADGHGGQLPADTTGRTPYGRVADELATAEVDSTTSETEND